MTTNNKGRTVATVPTQDTNKRDADITASTPARKAFSDLSGNAAKIGIDPLLGWHSLAKGVKPKPPPPAFKRRPKP